MKDLEIRQLNLKDEDLFLRGLEEWKGEDLDWYTFAWKPGMPHAVHILTLENEFKGINMAQGRVPHTMLYGIWKDQIIGRCSVRHRLNESLKKFGGHIGYAVAPRFRRQGFGMRLFLAGLKHLKELGSTQEALLTCAKSNDPSIKMIEKVGGVLVNELEGAENREESTLHFKVDLAQI